MVGGASQAVNLKYDCIITCNCINASLFHDNGRQATSPLYQPPTLLVCPFHCHLLCPMPSTHRPSPALVMAARINACRALGQLLPRAPATCEWFATTHLAPLLAAPSMVACLAGLCVAGAWAHASAPEAPGAPVRTVYAPLSPYPPFPTNTPTPLSARNLSCHIRFVVTLADSRRVSPKPLLIG